MKNLFKEMIFLGLGTVVAAKHKTEKVLEKLVNSHELTRDEGERIVESLKVRIQKIKQSTDEQIEGFVSRFAEKTNLAKEEVEEFVQSMLQKPKQAKKQLNNKTHALADKIVEKSLLTKKQANDMLTNFLDEVMLIRLEAEKEGKKLSRKIRQMSDQGKTMVDELWHEADAFISEIRPQMQKAMDKVIDRLDLANHDDLHSLEKRVDKLEQKEISK